MAKASGRAFPQSPSFFVPHAPSNTPVISIINSDSTPVAPQPTNADIAKMLTKVLHNQAILCHGLNKIYERVYATEYKFDHALKPGGVYYTLCVQIGDLKDYILQIAEDQ